MNHSVSKKTILILLAISICPACKKEKATLENVNPYGPVIVEVASLPAKIKPLECPKQSKLVKEKHTRDGGFIQRCLNDSTIGHGPSASYDKEGVIIMYQERKDGILQKQIEYIPPGVKFRVSNLYKGEGSGIRYYKNTTQKHVMTPYKNNEIHGDEIMWHPNGQLSLKRGFNMGILDGIWEQYDKNGKRTHSCKIANDSLETTTAKCKKLVNDYREDLQRLQQYQ